jgi:hypothetical protein
MFSQNSSANYVQKDIEKVWQDVNTWLIQILM